MVGFDAWSWMELSLVFSDLLTHQNLLHPLRKFLFYVNKPDVCLQRFEGSMVVSLDVHVVVQTADNN